MNKIKLRNIRSYISEEINFPKGTTLLSGDIGTGKSTILLAIEFALFGLKRGYGAGLLRNGSGSGAVELDFDIDGKKIVILRSLKRSKDSVKQDNGVLNGEGLSATELKQRILDLLNYPKEMLTKDSLIYRYTVYTPQEEMKQILTGDKDFRLDTLRKVFGFDKYKRIKENSLIFNSFLREKIKELEGRIFNLDDKRKELEVKIKESKELNSKLQKITPLFEQAKSNVDLGKNKIVSLELSVKSLNNFKNKLESSKKNLVDAEKEFKVNNEKLKGIKIIKFDSDKIKVIEEEVRGLRDLISTLNAKIKNCEEIKDKICKLDICPVCEQNVSSEYKDKVKSREEEKIKDVNIKLDKHMQILKFKEKELFELKKFDENNKLNIHMKNELEKRNSLLSSKIESLKAEINECESEIIRIGDVDKDYEIMKKELDNLVDSLRRVEIEKTKIESDLNNIKETLSMLEKDINEKIKFKTEKEKWSKIQFFVKEQFLSLMQEMEKKIMFKVHGDFDSLFRKWFNMMISNDLLSVCLDEEFSVIVEQNGHEIDYKYLSGGEKTSIALAYRLALNQVINSLMSHIKTKDLLILDEPTDGFSSEQLDKVRDVLDELDTGQVIIVSHNEKVESFVQNIIRLDKDEHISRIK